MPPLGRSLPFVSFFSTHLAASDDMLHSYCTFLGNEAGPRGDKACPSSAFPGIHLTPLRHVVTDPRRQTEQIPWSLSYNNNS